MNKTIATAALGALCCIAVVPPAGAQASGAVTTLVSRGGNAESQGCDVSAGGRAVAFGSAASNLVPRDTNDTYDVFLASDGGIERLSVTSRERQSAARTSQPTISDDGTRIAFLADGYRLTNAGGRRRHAFVRDAAAGVTARVSEGFGGARPDGGSGEAAITGDGRFVVFHSHAKNLTRQRDRDDLAEVYVRNLARGTTRASAGAGANDASGDGAPSRNGRFVAFTSQASDLVPGDDNRVQDVFRYDRKTARTIKVSVASDGSEARGPSHSVDISADGRFVAFVSQAGLDPSDLNSHLDVYVHDVLTGTTELVSAGPAGSGNSYSLDPSISADGRYVGFTSASSDLVPGDANGMHPRDEGTDVFVRDLQEDETALVGVGDDGQQGTGDSGGIRISPDGAYVCWTSYAPDLVNGDDNDAPDVFLRGPLWTEED